MVYYIYYYIKVFIYNIHIKGEGSMNSKDAVVLFSGGRDCSLSACLLAEKNYRVHLLHYNNGAVISNNLHRIRYKELKNLIGEDKLLLKEVSTAGLFRKLSLSTLENDAKKYKTSLICLGCRMGMHIETILYALKHNIKVVADGSIKYQNDFPEQSQTALNLFKELYSRFGIEYITPVIEIDNAKEVKYKLLDYGISIQSMEDTCLFSNTFSEGHDDDISDFINTRIDFCEKYINSKLKIQSQYDEDGKGIYKDEVYR